MVGRPKSDTKKAQILREAAEDLRARAIKAYQLELAKPPHVKPRGARKIAEDFENIYRQETGKTIKLNYMAIIRGANGGRSRAAANAARSWLTKEETNIVIQYITEVGNRGFPLSHRRLKEHVDEILRARLGDKFPSTGVGKNWTDRFVEKYSEQIKMSWSSPLESKRARAVNPHTIEAWFNLLEETVKSKEIVPECTYGADEVGCNPSGGEDERVMGGRKSGPQYQQRDGDRENITVIETICADGTSIPPAVIFKGQAFQVKWKQDNPAHAS